MKQTGTTFDLFPKTHKDVTPREFLRLANADRSNIKSTRIIAPRIGSRNFGRIRIEFKSPEYSVK